MDNLSVAVILTRCRKRLHIPVKWIKDIDFGKVFNAGAKKSEDRIMFYSPDATIPPDFNAPLTEIFDPNVNACYIGRVLRGFGEC